jgi:hypothetical protein
MEQLYIEEFGAFKCENKKMNNCTDEWTSCRTRRYMNIHILHFTESRFNKNSWELSCRKGDIFTSGKIKNI